MNGTDVVVTSEVIYITLRRVDGFSTILIYSDYVCVCQMTDCFESYRARLLHLFSVSTVLYVMDCRAHSRNL
jgi:hypothetical protein